MFRLFPCILSVLCLAGSLRADEVKPPRLNVLFIVADDLRPELGCYGSPALTPNIDGLAKRGVRFDRAYCQQALCNPSRSSFLTGLRPDTLHLWVNGTHFREKNPDVITLPQWFKEHGYITRDVGKIFHNWHTKVKGDRRSWTSEEFLYYANHGDDKPMVDEPAPKNLAKFPRCEQRDVPDEAYYDGRVAKEAVRVLGEIKDKPFFLAVGFWKPHAPFNAPRNTGIGMIGRPCRRWIRLDRRERPTSPFTKAWRYAACLRSNSRSPPTMLRKSATATLPTRPTWTPNWARCWPPSTRTNWPTRH